jgi:hypothetical protein
LNSRIVSPEISRWRQHRVRTPRRHNSMKNHLPTPPLDQIHHRIAQQNLFAMMNVALAAQPESNQSFITWQGEATARTTTNRVMPVRQSVIVSPPLDRRRAVIYSISAMYVRSTVGGDSIHLWHPGAGDLSRNCLGVPFIGVIFTDCVKASANTISPFDAAPILPHIINDGLFSMTNDVI